MEVTTGKLAEALAKAQLEFTAVKKSRTASIPTKSGKDYSYNYADLADVLDMCRPILNKHGIALSQPLRLMDGKIRVSTRIQLGAEVLESDGIAINENLLPREFGAMLTYWRRYDGSSFLGISTEDDIDVQKARKADGKSAGTEKFDKKSENEMRLQEPIKEFQVRAFTVACNESSRTKAEIATFLKNLKHSRPDEILKGEFDMAIKWAVAPQRTNGGVMSSCNAHGQYPGEGNCPGCEGDATYIQGKDI